MHKMQYEAFWRVVCAEMKFRLWSDCLRFFLHEENSSGVISIMQDFPPSKDSFLDFANRLKWNSIPCEIGPLSLTSLNSIRLHSSRTYGALRLFYDCFAIQYNLRTLTSAKVVGWRTGRKRCVLSAVSRGNRQRVQSPEKISWNNFWNENRGRRFAEALNAWVSLFIELDCVKFLRGQLNFFWGCLS